MAGLKENPNFTPKELAERWGISPLTLSNWRCNHQGPAYIKVGRRVFYPVKDVESFEEQSRVKK